MQLKKTVSSIVLVDKNMRIIPEVLDFINYLIQNGSSVNTIESYLRDLKVFYEWMSETGYQFFEVKTRDIRDFVRFIDGRHRSGKVSASTLSGYLSTVNSFYRHHATMGGWVIENPIAKTFDRDNPQANQGFLRHVISPLNKNGIHYLKRKKKKSSIDIKWIRYQEALQFYKAIGEIWSTNEDLMIRNKLIFKLLYESGFRISEVLHLRMDDFDYPDGVRKTGNLYLVERDEPNPDRQLKTGERIVPVSSELLAEIDNYIMYHRPEKEGVRHIFVTHHAKTKGEPVSRTSVEDFFREVSEYSGIKCTPHALRHTHASNLKEMGLDLTVISERLGHSIVTASKYGKMSLDTQIMAFERYLETKGEMDRLE
ncbi:tyrosine-type recombinase/integrase [Paenibacillus sp. WQ 127069]|uniref:Tyrosine-type recombinase/integrase n=1 Tax=Paenibacillus baimaensis TaxID=2982185 RepID=A0ABT2UCK8_9BACL|nr:tyrosine-type recombinase/integrase [Paenibacillus sp. WQ 127069]MCU6791901.1 tyrosine-type recombinase/integrase [Paenibacillus sp. WQ 127069]